LPLMQVYVLHPHANFEVGHPSVDRRNEYQRKLGIKQAHRAMQ